MRGALAIAAAEIRAHRLALWLGAVVGALVTGGAAFFLAERTAHASAVAEHAVLYSGLVSISVAVALGAAAVSRDIAERRLGFFLSRPLSPLAYWGGKLAAALFLAVAAGTLVLLPALLFEDASWRDLALFARRSRFWLVVLAFFVAASSAAAGAVRARSGLIILDMVMAPLTWAAFLVAFGSTWRAGTTEVVVHMIPWLFLIATLVLLAAGAAQVAVGRLDLQRGHALLSAIAWSGLLACVGALLLFSRVVASATPADLRLPHGVSIHAPAAGDRVMLEGPSTGWRGRPSGPFGRFWPGLLVDSQGGFVRMGGLEGLTGFAWSQDGRSFAWSKDSLFGAGSVDYVAPAPLQAIPGFQPSLWIIDFDRPSARPRQVPRSSIAGEDVRALSPSGQRLLLARSRSKVVADVESGRTVASLDEPQHWTSPRFLSETVVRALRIAHGQARIVEWDLVGGRLTERGAITLQAERGWFASLAPTGDWQRVLRFDSSGLFLHDLDGRVVATLVGGWPTGMSRAAGPLSGGRFGSVEQEREGLRLRVFDSDGRPKADARFKGRFPLRVGGEGAPGLLALGVAPVAEDGQRETLFVDLATGDVVRREPGISPALRRWTAPESLGPRNPARGESALPIDSLSPEPGSLATRLFLSEEGIVRLDDPVSGKRSVLIRRRDRLED